MPFYGLRTSKDSTEEMLPATSWELRRQSRESERPRVVFARKKASAHKARCIQKYRDFSPPPV